MGCLQLQSLVNWHSRQPNSALAGACPVLRHPRMRWVLVSVQANVRRNCSRITVVFRLWPAFQPLEPWRCPPSLARVAFVPHPRLQRAQQLVSHTQKVGLTLAHSMCLAVFPVSFKIAAVLETSHFRPKVWTPFRLTKDTVVRYACPPCHCVASTVVLSNDCVRLAGILPEAPEVVSKPIRRVYHDQECKESKEYERPIGKKVSVIPNSSSVDFLLGAFRGVRAMNCATLPRFDRNSIIYAVVPSISVQVRTSQSCAARQSTNLNAY
jgi:hypothetical protein